jgi:hypothetical protein
MPYHVEISSSTLRHARAFNLEEEQLLASIVEPWLADRAIELGDQEWLPAECSLKILEGPELAAADLSFGQGWANAERRCEEVTRRVLETAPPPHTPDAFVIEAGGVAGLDPEALAARRPLEWQEAKRLLDDRDPEVAAVILVRRPGPPASA